MKTISVILVLLFSFLKWGGPPLHALDHNDGTSIDKSQALEISDVYAFREGDHSGTLTQNNNMILVMNSSPGGLPGQSMFFSTLARYEFFLTRVLTENKAVAPTGLRNIVIRLVFEEPDPKNLNKQKVEATFIIDGVTRSVLTTVDEGNIVTTPYPGTNPINNLIKVNDHLLTLFAGMREDPAFFDLVQFFRVRAGIFANPTLPMNPVFNPVGSASDYTKNSNVNSIVIRAPIEFLSGRDEGTTGFDVWGATSLAQPE